MSKGEGSLLSILIISGYLKISSNSSPEVFCFLELTVFKEASNLG